jgi:hypothetical protein
MPDKQKTQEIESYVHNSFIKAKENDKEKYLFYGTSDGIYARLNGYAVVPIEEYFELIGEPVPQPFGGLDGFGGFINNIADFHKEES